MENIRNPETHMLHNGLFIPTHSWKNFKFAFVCPNARTAREEFDKNSVRVKLLYGMYEPNCIYKIFFCKCRKRDVEKFLRSLENLEKRLTLCGYSDYRTYCDDIIPALQRKRYRTAKTKVLPASC